MPPRKKSSTTKLPQSLLEEINGNDNSTRRKRSSKPKVSRKDARKQERAGLKQRKAQYFSSAPGTSKRAAEEEHDDSPKRKRAKTEIVNDADRPSATPQPQPPKKTQPKPPPAKPPVPAAKSKAPEPKASKPEQPSLRSQKEIEEDNYIKHLESKLGYVKSGKGKKKAEDDDGLDDLLDFTTSILSSSKDVDMRDDASFSDMGDSEFSDEDEDEDEEDEIDDEEWGGIEQSEDDAEGDQQILDTHIEDKPAATTRYIPPHLRNSQSEDTKNSEIIIKLKRQLNGLLNRMSEQNMANILDSVEEIYRNHRRNDVTSTITTLIIDGIASHSSLLDSYVVLHASFISSLHKIIGIEFAAYFVQNVVATYERHYAALENDIVHKNEEDNADSTLGKECSNIIVLISELYNFQVISSVLVFDIIRGLLQNEITEFNVELLLKVVRNSGQQLRQDDPSALKDIIQIVQNKLGDHEDALSSRTRFMVETLTNFKNNKHKRNVTQNQGGEAVERMKKFLTGLGKKRTIMAHEPLRVSLEDLHSAESKGKWWLVGAAWGGDPLVDRQEAPGQTGAPATAADAHDVSNNVLLKLARKQGMNTDIRRSIFVVLMSSDDYVDACERLSQLNLTEVQQREIVRVLLHCCGNEKTYNPYYTLVCQQLSRTSHSYKVTLQFCLWDFLRDLGETNVGGVEVIKNLNDGGNVETFDVKSISSTRMRNVAKAYAWWIAKDSVTLSVLKPIDFALLKPRTTEFLKELFTQVFINSQVATPMLSPDPKDLPKNQDRKAIEEIFIKANRTHALAMGLVYFLGEAFKSAEGMDETLWKFVKWANGIARNTLQTGMDVVPNL